MPHICHIEITAVFALIPQIEFFYYYGINVLNQISLKISSF